MNDRATFTRMDRSTAADWQLIAGEFKDFSLRLGDRILALDTMVINGIALTVLYGILSQTAVYFELSLIIAMVGFVSTVAYARFMLRGNVIE